MIERVTERSERERGQDAMDKQRELSLHARRTRKRTSRTPTEPQKRRGSTNRDSPPDAPYLFRFFLTYNNRLYTVHHLNTHIDIHSYTTVDVNVLLVCSDAIVPLFDLLSSRQNNFIS